MRINNDTLLASTDGTTSPSSGAYPLAQVYGFAIQMVITGTLAGTVKLQGSTDPGVGPGSSRPNVTNWTDIAGSSVTVSGAGTVTWNFNGAFYSWVQLVYTNASGTGNVSAQINTKG